MKIAFVGKGGSGKSTLSGLFIHHLIARGERVLAIDADINQHLADMVGAELDPGRALYFGDNAAAVRTVLRGTNQRIKNAKQFVKTTPPGGGSHLVRLMPDDPVLRDFAVSFADGNFFMHAGTYDREGIGISCYHSNLAVVENVISHTVLDEYEWLVADMVAGTDAFSGALHVMFDAIFMVVEPTPESVAVFRQFIGLAREAGMAETVHAVANKVMDDGDIAYLRQALDGHLATILPHSAQLRRIRQQGGGIDRLANEMADQLDAIRSATLDTLAEPAAKLARLHAMHRRYASQNFTIAKHGDISSQIDPLFSSPQ